ncbi:transcriptional regulator, partial [Methanococcoides sp. SA1]|nr:transcriptional regulator [Methanococcoides sp. SA1]
TGVSEYSNAMVKRAHLMSSISNVIETQSVFIIEGKSRYKFVEDTVLIERDELNTIADADDLDTLIHERAKRHKEE